MLRLSHSQTCSAVHLLEGCRHLQVLSEDQLTVVQLIDLQKGSKVHSKAGCCGAGVSRSTASLLVTCRQPVPRAYEPRATSRALLGIHLQRNSKSGLLHGNTKQV